MLQLDVKQAEGNLEDIFYKSILVEWYFLNMHDLIDSLYFYVRVPKKESMRF